MSYHKLSQREIDNILPTLNYHMLGYRAPSAQAQYRPEFSVVGAIPAHEFQ